MKNSFPNENKINDIVNLEDRNKDLKHKNSIIGNTGSDIEIETSEIKVNDSKPTINTDEAVNNIKLIDKEEKELDEHKIHVQEPVEQSKLKYSPIFQRLYFPPHIKKLSRIYSSLLTIQRFNNQKFIKTIFIKTKACLERMVNDNVNLYEMEQINYLVKDVKIKELSIVHNERNVRTFSIELPNLNFDKILWEFVWENYVNFLGARKHFGNKFQYGFEKKDIDVVPRKGLFAKDDNKITNIQNKKSNEISDIRVFPNEKRKENISVTNNQKLLEIAKETGSLVNIKNLEEKIEKDCKSNLSNENLTSKKKREISENVENKKRAIENAENSREKRNRNNIDTNDKESVIKSAKEKTQSILERIKEKERKRKEEFILNSQKEYNYGDLKIKIDNLFIIEKKTALKISFISKVLSLFKARDKISNLCNVYQEYRIVEVNNEEFVAKRI